MDCRIIRALTAASFWMQGKCLDCSWAAAGAKQPFFTYFRQCLSNPYNLHATMRRDSTANSLHVHGPLDKTVRIPLMNDWRHWFQCKTADERFNTTATATLLMLEGIRQNTADDAWAGLSGNGYGTVHYWRTIKDNRQESNTSDHRTYEDICY